MTNVTKKLLVEAQIVLDQCNPRTAAVQQGELAPFDLSALVAIRHRRRRMLAICEQRLLANPDCLGAIATVHAHRTVVAINGEIKRRVTALRQRVDSDLGSRMMKVEASDVDDDEHDDPLDDTDYNDAIDTEDPEDTEDTDHAKRKNPSPSDLRGHGGEKAPWSGGRGHKNPTIPSTPEREAFFKDNQQEIVRYITTRAKSFSYTHEKAVRAFGGQDDIISDLWVNAVENAKNTFDPGKGKHSDLKKDFFAYLAIKVDGALGDIERGTKPERKRIDDYKNSNAVSDDYENEDNVENDVVSDTADSTFNTRRFSQPDENFDEKRTITRLMEALPPDLKPAMEIIFRSEGEDMPVTAGELESKYGSDWKAVLKKLWQNESLQDAIESELLPGLETKLKNVMYYKPKAEAPAQAPPIAARRFSDVPDEVRALRRLLN